MREIDRYDYPYLCDKFDNIKAVWGTDNSRLLFQEKPISYSSDPLYSFDYAVSVFTKKDGQFIHVASIVLERLYLDLFAELTGESLKDLKKEYKVKGYVSNPHLSIYTQERYEDTGEYLGETEPFELQLLLTDMALNIIRDNQELEEMDFNEKEYK